MERLLTLRILKVKVDFADPGDAMATEYENINAVNYSTLKYMALSPLHFKHAVENPRLPSDAMLRGTAIHAAIFEPEKFKTQFRVYPGPVRRGKEWEAWRLANMGCVNVTQKDLDAVTVMSEAFFRNRRAAEFVAKGAPELTIEWTDDESGIRCKGRLDFLCDIDIIVGLKSAKCAERGAFGRQAMSLLYPLQWAMYHDGFLKKTGRKPQMMEIVLESKAPHDSVIYRVTEQVLDVGRALFRKYITRLAECRDKNEWPGYGDVLDVELPAWATALDGVEPVLDLDGEEIG